jgi:hypothetical protein
MCVFKFSSFQVFLNLLTQTKSAYIGVCEDMMVYASTCRRTQLLVVSLFSVFEMFFARNCQDDVLECGSMIGLALIGEHLKLKTHEINLKTAYADICFHMATYMSIRTFSLCW